VVVIYVSSHGSPSGMDVSGVNYIVAYDTNRDSLFSTGIPMQDLVRIIKARVHSDRIVLILDACHSGSASPNAKGVFQQGNVNVDEIVAGTGQMVISSSAPDQVSWEAKGEPNGVFTKYLIEGLRQKGKGTTLGEAYQYMKDKVQEQVLAERGVLQTPILKSKWEGKELALLTPPTKPRPALKELPAEVRPNSEVKPEGRTEAAPQPAAQSGEKSPQAAAPAVPSSQLTLWNTYIDAAQNELQKQHYHEAKRMLAEAQKEAEGFPTGDPRRTTTMMGVADVNYLEGNFNAAEPMYWQVMSDMEHTAKPDNSKVASIMTRLAGIALRNNNYSDADKLAMKALSIEDDIKNVDPATTAGTLDVLASAAIGNNDPKQAETLARRALTLRDGMPTPDERDLTKNLCCLNKALIAQEKFSDADSTAQRALTLSEKSFGPNSAETAECLELYSQVLTKLNRSSDARKYDTRAKSIRKKLIK